MVRIGVGRVVCSLCVKQGSLQVVQRSQANDIEASVLVPCRCCLPAVQTFCLAAFGRPHITVLVPVPLHARARPSSSVKDQRLSSPIAALSPMLHLQRLTVTVHRFNCWGSLFDDTPCFVVTSATHLTGLRLHVIKLLSKGLCCIHRCLSTWTPSNPSFSSPIPKNRNENASA